MGLSILIPVYNFDVTELVNNLSGQLHQSEIDGEIVILDDASDLYFTEKNRELANISSVKYQRNEFNLGRTNSRKKLAETAIYEYLLFLDCDSEIISADFIKKYVEQTNLNSKVVSGGRVYYSEPPDSCDLRLHWKYGLYRESNKKRKNAFMSNNFMIQKSVFQNLDFSFILEGYGHEDSLWGIQLKKKGVIPMYIDNAILHGKLETSAVFLTKSHRALMNLHLLSKSLNKNDLEREIKIFKSYRRLKGFMLLSLFIFIAKPFLIFMRKNLLSCNPSLFFFDVYRMVIFTYIVKGKRLPEMTSK